MSKPHILFFARGYQADFYPELTDDRYEAVFVTMTRSEADRVRAKGQTVTACFEEDFDTLVPAEIPPNYLRTSFMSDRFLGRFDHDVRLDILGKEIAFWRGLMERFDPVAVMNELVAIEISEVLLIESRARKIPYLAALMCVIDGYFYWLPNPITLSGQELDLPTQPSESSLALADAYLEELRQVDYKPYYVRNLSGRRSLKPFLAGLAKSLVWRWRDWRSRDPSHPGTFRYETYSEEYTKRLQMFFASFTKGYDELDAIPEDREIVLYPLHQEPEAKLNYMSEFRADQVATIENVLKCLGPHQVLVVKEHPVDKGSLLRPKFQDLRARSSNLRLLPGEVSGRAVLARADRVATLNSTVGWEAAVLGKCVCIMGEFFYDDLPGVHRIESWQQLREIMRTPVEKLEKLTPDAARNFVAGMIDISYPCNPLPHTDLYTPENIAKVRDAIVDGAKIATSADTLGETLSETTISG
ncbi:MAG: hypothetical protein AAF250_06285 [Pseudomonadota bacterium]